MGNAPRAAVRHRDTRREIPSPGLPNRDARGKGNTAKKNANVVQPTDRRIPPLPRPPNSGSRSFSPRLQSWGNAPRAAGHPGRPDASHQARGYPIEMPGKKVITAKKNANVVQPTDRRISSLLWRSRSGSRQPSAHGFSRGATRPERPGTPGGPTRDTMPGVTQSKCRGKRAPSGRAPQGCPTRETKPGCIIEFGVRYPVFLNIEHRMKKHFPDTGGGFVFRSGAAQFRFRQSRSSKAALSRVTKVFSPSRSHTRGS